MQALGQLRIFSRILREHPSPLCPQVAPALSNPILKMLAHALRHQKFGVLGPAIEFLHQPDFIFAKRLAVGGIGILLVRRSVTDMAVHYYQRGTISCLLES